MGGARPPGRPRRPLPHLRPPLYRERAVLRRGGGERATHHATAAAATSKRGLARASSPLLLVRPQFVQSPSSGSSMLFVPVHWFHVLALIQAFLPLSHQPACGPLCACAGAFLTVLD